MDEIKDAARDIWRNKPLAIALGIAAAFLLYMWYRNSQGGFSNPNTPAVATSSGGNGTYVEESYYYNNAPVSTTTNNNPVGTPSPPLPIPTSPSMRTALVRAPSPEDIKHKIGGAPLKKAIGGKADVTHIPWGATITINGSPFTGPWNKPLSGGNGSNQWYNVTWNTSTGFFSAWDVAGG